MKYYCNCWLCTKAKTKKAIAREKEKRLFRCRPRMVDVYSEKV